MILLRSIKKSTSGMRKRISCLRSNSSASSPFGYIGYNNIWRLGQVVKTPPFRWIGLVARHLTCVEEFSSILESDTNGGNTSSNLVGVTI